jgi:hypothetical protein
MRSENVLTCLEEQFAPPGARFQWHRKRGGYEIAEGWESDYSSFRFDPNPAIFLAETLTARGRNPEWYDPVGEHAALFQEALSLDISTDSSLLDSLLRLANEWGLPTEPTRFIRDNPHESKLSWEEKNRRVEPGWRVDGVTLYPLLRLGPTVQMWDILKSASASQLRRLFAQPVDDRWEFIDRNKAKIQLLVDNQFRALAERGDFRTILARLLQDVTNKMLTRGSSPALLWEPNALSFDIKMVPHDLIGFMWAQFAEAVAGGKGFRKCASCAQWMEIAPGQGRPEKSYCSDACRMRAYRKRKAQRGRRASKTAVR